MIQREEKLCYIVKIGRKKQKNIWNFEQGRTMTDQFSALQHQKIKEVSLLFPIIGQKKKDGWIQNLYWNGKTGECRTRFIWGRHFLL